MFAHIRTIRLLMLFALIGLLAACVPAPATPAAEAPPPDATELPQQETPQTEIPTLPEGAVIVYHKTGCFAGVDEELTVNEDGRLAFVERGGAQVEHPVEAGELETLRALLADPAWSEVLPQYQAPGADFCNYAFRFRVADAPVREVTTMDTAPAPAIVESLHAEMDRLLALVQSH